MKVKTFKEALHLINVSESERASKVLEQLTREGYKENAIGYSVWKEQDKLMSFRGDSRFWSIFINAVRKHGYK